MTDLVQISIPSCQDSKLSHHRREWWAEMDSNRQGKMESTKDALMSGSVVTASEFSTKQDWIHGVSGFALVNTACSTGSQGCLRVWHRSKYLSRYPMPVT